MFRSRRRSGSTSRASSSLPARLYHRRKRSHSQQCHFERLENRINLDSYIWTQTVAGTFSWTSPSNWHDQSNPSNSSYPHLAGDVANITTALTGNETISMPGFIINLDTLDIYNTNTNNDTYFLQSGSIDISSAINDLAGGPDEIGGSIGLARERRSTFIRGQHSILVRESTALA